MPVICMVVFFIPIVLVGKLTEIFADQKALILISALIFALLVVAIAIWSVIFSIVVISQAMKLSRKRAILIYSIAFLPTFIIYDILF